MSQLIYLPACLIKYLRGMFIGKSKINNSWNNFHTQCTVSINQNYIKKYIKLLNIGT